MENLNDINIKYVVEKKSTINDILKNVFDMSLRLKNKLINSHSILLNGTFVDTRNLASPGDVLTIVLNHIEDNSNIIAKKMELEIVYEDSHILVLNKPYGIPVHPSMLHYTDSLSNAVKWYYDTIGLNKKIRPVNRIDLNTSGLVLFAKNEYIQECLIKQMNNKDFVKTYLAIVLGQLPNKEGIINLPIARKENSIIERCVSSDGQPAITKYKVIKEFKDYSLVECILETGRTHQIRVHMSYIGNPLIGDTLYSTTPTFLMSRQALHSYKMKFYHPVTKEKLEFIAPIPNDFKKIL